MHVYFADLWATKDEIDSLRRRRSKLWQCVCRLAMERDSVERESREKETKILSVNRQLEELQDRLAESDRLRSQQQRELDSYANSQDDVGKNVCCLALSVSLVKFLTFINLFVALLVFLVSVMPDVHVIGLQSLSTFNFSLSFHCAGFCTFQQC